MCRAPVTSQNNNRITDLMIAASRGDYARVESLLREGSEVDARDVFGYTALMYAASAGHQAIAEELVNAGANVEARNRNGASVFELASAKGHTAVAALLRHARLFLAARDGDLATVEALLEAGADVNALLRDGWTSLMIATLHNHPQIVALLIRRGAYVDAQNCGGRRRGEGRADRRLPFRS